MAEKDITVRLRNAVKENNLFIVKRLIKKIDMRNPDAASKRYTSLAWAAVLGHEETFEFLLAVGHDDEESSKDSENNTIPMLLAETKPPPPDPYSTISVQHQDMSGAILRMARLYIDRYSKILDWSNVQGRTALHLAALMGNEELARMFCDLGADVNLSDNCGNTPLHYASSWGHVAIVQLLIERGCIYTVKNNYGFTASDYAYSHSTQDTLQNTARLQYELQKKQRRNQANQRLEASAPPVPPKDRDDYSRTSSGSGTSRVTVSDSGEIDNIVPTSSQLALSLPSPSQSSLGSGSHHTVISPGSTGGLSSTAAKAIVRSPPSNHATVLSPIATRVREMDADAMEKYMRRTRSGSQDTPPHDGFQQTSGTTVQDDVATLARRARDLMSMPRRLRPSASAAQLRTTSDSPVSDTVTQSKSESRTRAGTNPSTAKPMLSPIPMLTRSTTSDSLQSLFIAEQSGEEVDGYTGPPSQYAQFPGPPAPDDPAPTVHRRKGLHMLLKSSTGDGASHRRGMSATSVRGS
ncbi:hypothetical protein AX15_002986 [Amanita polypyramis BW_CC]|nr:hypothetical protein AX15_002986 [Amanita polypyramis BW_CC]